MSKDNIKVESRAELTESQKTREQAKDAEAIKKKKQKAAEDAEKAHAAAEAEKEEAARKAKEEEEKLAAEKEAQSEQIAALAAGAAAAALKNTGKIRWNDFLKGALIGLLCGMLIAYFILDRMYQNMMNAQTETPAETEEPSGPSSVEFEEAVLEAASEHSELIVMEQPLSIPTTITKSGLGNLAIFSKVKDVTYYGTGVYTVDLSKIDAKHIRTDLFNRTVNILIPHAVLQYVNPDLSRTEFQDTEKGWLAFGDIKLTTEESNELEKSVMSAMEERLNQDDLLIQADEFAVLKTWEIFQPIIASVSPEYTVEMEFSE